MKTAKRLTNLSAALCMAAMLFGCKHQKPGQQTLKSAVNFVYTRPDAPGIQIPVYSPVAGQGALSKREKAILIDTFNKLPASHVAAVGAIGAAANILPRGILAEFNPDNNSIILDLAKLHDPATFRHALLHETAHAVQFHLLGVNSNTYQAFIALHNASSSPLDYVTLEAKVGTDAYAGDDFAETYAAWVDYGNIGTDAFAFDAVNAALQGHTLLLQKFLFTAALFANPDHTVNFYSLVPSLLVTKRPYYRTANSLTIGDFTFVLKGNKITAIKDPFGNLIADNLSIPVPRIVFNRLPLTGPAPSAIAALSDSAAPPAAGATDTLTGADFPAASSPLLAAPALGSIHAINEIPLGAIQNVQIVSPNLPTHYVPLMSPEGSRAWAGERALGHNPNKPATVQDQIRPHGEFQITDPTPSAPVSSRKGNK